MNPDLQRLLDMIDYLDRIERHRQQTFEEFAGSELVIGAVMHWIAVVGEAAANVSDDTRSSHPEVPWQRIVGMRNQLIHAYPSVDVELLWEVVKNDGPSLRAQVQAILDHFE